jgi:DNA-binding NtrC family response regulator
MARVLLIDDDLSLRDVVSFILTEAGHEVAIATNGDAGVEAFDANPPDLVLTDLKMPGRDGMGVLRHVRDADPGVPVIMFTAYGTVEQAVEAMQLGAFSYLLKPFNRDEMLLTVERALHSRELEADNSRLRRVLRERPGGPPFLYASSAMAALVERLRLVADAEVNVLVTGESGVGKELVARALHDMSPRADGPYVAVNCGAIPDTLVESELFGHKRGAFTGAHRDAPGRIRAADGGTLFLDEIGEIPATSQAKLLRSLETRTVDPVGGDGAVSSDFRLVSATNIDLAAAVADGRFREDLYYRLNVMPLHVPPLGERPDDIPLLWDHFTELHAGRRIPSTPELMAELTRRSWPGNVRELKNVNQRLVVLRRGDQLDVEDLAHSGESPTKPEGGLPLGPLPADGLSLKALEREIIRRALAMHDGNKSRTAAYLDVPRHVLIYRIEKYGL